MKSDSKRCPIEPSLSCDIVDECNPIAVSDSDINVDFPRSPHVMFDSNVYVVSLRCPYLKSGAKRRGKADERNKVRLQ